MAKPVTKGQLGFLAARITRDMSTRGVLHREDAADAKASVLATLQQWYADLIEIKRGPTGFEQTKLYKKA